MGIGEHIKQAGLAFRQALDRKGSGGDPAASESGYSLSESSTSMLHALTGSVGDIEDFYFPPDLIGGICPRIAGKEEEIVWNAAAEACDSERVHVVWQGFGSYIWYLAVRSADIASHAHSWCPLAALLPTARDAENLPLCYTYFGEELAVLMVVTTEELHIFRGTAAVVRAKTERTVRELGDKARTINVDLFRIGQMTPVPWYSASLFEDRVRRVLSTVSVLASLLIVGLSFLVWLSASMAMIAARHDLTEAQENTKIKTMNLLREAEGSRSSPLREQIAKFLNVNDGLLSLNGFLTVYEIKERVTRWRAVVPPSATADRISAMGGRNIESNDQGASIGNDAEIEYEANKEKR